MASPICPSLPQERGYSGQADRLADDQRPAPASGGIWLPAPASGRQQPPNGVGAGQGSFPSEITAIMDAAG